MKRQKAGGLASRRPSQSIGRGRISGKASERSSRATEAERQMATHNAAVNAQNLRKRGCAAAATATPTGGCTHGLLSCVCRVAPKGAARRALRGCSGGGLHGAVPSPRDQTRSRRNLPHRRRHPAHSRSRPPAPRLPRPHLSRPPLPRSKVQPRCWARHWAQPQLRRR